MEGRLMATRFSSTVGVGLLLLASVPVHARAVIPLGGEFQVNVVAGGTQDYSSVGVDADGDFVVVWKSFDGSEFGIFARRFSSSGAALGGQFQINTYTPNDQSLPVVDVDADGDFVVAWESEAQDGDLLGVFARRFSSAGAALTAALMVNTTTANTQRSPSVGTDADGDFVVAWNADFQDGSGFGVFARRFNSMGIAQGGEFQGNSFTPGGQGLPTIDLDADGDFVVSWSSAAQDGSLYGIFGQRFSAAGAKLGPEFQINTTFTYSQLTPKVGVDSDGDFVVVWYTIYMGTIDVLGQRFSSTGAPQGAEFAVNSYRPGAQYFPAIAVDEDGDFVVAWQSDSGDGSGKAITARRFKSSGLPASFDTRVNTTTAGGQVRAGVGAAADGDFVVTWTSPEGSYPNIFAQRFDAAMLLDVDGDGEYLPLTDGLLLLRFGFEFTGATLITGAVGPGCTRCDAPSITAYLQSLL
jgi:hypothetical protein